MFRRIWNDSVHVHYLQLCDIALTPNRTNVHAYAIARGQKKPKYARKTPFECLKTQREDEINHLPMTFSTNLTKG